LPRLKTDTAKTQPCSAAVKAALEATSDKFTGVDVIGKFLQAEFTGTGENDPNRLGVYDIKGYSAYTHVQGTTCQGWSDVTEQACKSYCIENAEPPNCADVYSDPVVQGAFDALSTHFGFPNYLGSGWANRRAGGCQRMTWFPNGDPSTPGQTGTCHLFNQGVDANNEPIGCVNDYIRNNFESPELTERNWVFSSIDYSTADHADWVEDTGITLTCEDIAPNRGKVCKYDRSPDAFYDMTGADSQTDYTHQEGQANNPFGVRFSTTSSKKFMVHMIEQAPTSASAPFEPAQARVGDAAWETVGGDHPLKAFEHAASNFGTVASSGNIDGKGREFSTGYLVKFAGTGTTFDRASIPLYPATTEVLFGTPSSEIAITKKPLTTVQASCEDGVYPAADFPSRILDHTNVYLKDFGDDKTYFRSGSCMIQSVAVNAADTDRTMSAIQLHASPTSWDSSSFLPESMLGQTCVPGLVVDYVHILSLQENTVCATTGKDGFPIVVELESQTLSNGDTLSSALVSGNEKEGEYAAHSYSAYNADLVVADAAWYCTHPVKMSAGAPTADGSAEFNVPCF